MIVGKRRDFLLAWLILESQNLYAYLKQKIFIISVIFGNCVSHCCYNHRMFFVLSGNNDLIFKIKFIKNRPLWPGIVKVAP